MSFFTFLNYFDTIKLATPAEENRITIYLSNGATELQTMQLPTTVSFTIPQYPTGV